MSEILLTGSAVGERKSGRDIGFACGIIAILSIFFLPIPAFIIDIGLAFSIALSVLILMVALWIERPLDFSAFPTVLLVATLLRLALNIATTRLILANGPEGLMAAGYIIGGFSKLVMSGDFVIGLIVFAILITVNFVVITKGATRIAEVGARFTLDTIPSKQMAIDADLSAGLIDDKARRSRRRFYEIIGRRRLGFPNSSANSLAVCGAACVEGWHKRSDGEGGSQSACQISARFVGRGSAHVPLGDHAGTAGVSLCFSRRSHGFCRLCGPKAAH